MSKEYPYPSDVEVLINNAVDSALYELKEKGIQYEAYESTLRLVLKVVVNEVIQDVVNGALE